MPSNEQIGGTKKNNSVPSKTTNDDPPIFSVTIWPHRSLPREGFKAIMLFTAFMLAIPLIPLLGTPVGLALVPFLLCTLGLLWLALRRSYRDGHELREDVMMWPDLMRVVRSDPDGRVREWEANPYWIRTEIQRTAKLENYLTLKGGPREIEIGAFLSPGERLALRDDIERALGQARGRS